MLKRFLFACGLGLGLLGVVVLAHAQAVPDTIYVGGPWYDVIKLDRRTQGDSLDVQDQLLLPEVAGTATCAGDPKIFVDTNDSNRLKYWNGTECITLAYDADQDGVVNANDGNPNTAFTFTADTPFALQVTTTYSGTDAQVDINGTDRYLRVPAGGATGCDAAALCKAKGDLSVSSFTTGTASPRYNLFGGNNTCANSGNLASYLSGAVTTLSGTAEATSGVAVTGATCIGVRGT